MYDAPGLGLAAPQVGVQKQLFVYDIGDGTSHAHQPRDHRVARRVGLRRGLPLGARASTSRWCARRRSISSGVDLDGNDVSIEADELLARLFQHELDHLDGVLLFDASDARPAQGRLERAPPPRSQDSRRRRAPARPVAPGRPVPALRRLSLVASPSSARRRWRSARCERSSAPASTCRSSCTRADKRRAVAAATIAEPGEGRGARARPARSRARSTTCWTQAPISVWSSRSVS